MVFQSELLDHQLGFFGQISISEQNTKFVISFCTILLFVVYVCGAKKIFFLMMVVVDDP